MSIVSDANASQSAASTADKYTRVAHECARLRSQVGVLKQAVLDGRQKYEELSVCSLAFLFKPYIVCRHHQRTRIANVVSYNRKSTV